MLSTPQGAIDWSGLELVAALLGADDDLEGLVRRLMAIKNRRPE